MILEHQCEPRTDEPTSPTIDAAKRTNNAIRDTARTYLRKLGVTLDIIQIEHSIREKPLRSMAIAAATGFIVGGGMATRPGVAMLALFSRRVARETAANLIIDMVMARAQ